MPDQPTAFIPTQHAAPYDGLAPFPSRDQPPGTAGGRARASVTAAIVTAPFCGLAAAMWLAWGHGLSLADILLAVAFYLVTGLGVTVGFHRLLTHRAFTARRPLRIALAIAGSMTFQGDVIGWVAIHRRHHAFTDRPGDPHSPYRYGTGLTGQLRGLAHAHAGWLLRDDPTPPARYAPDMVADPAMRAVSAAFPALCAASLALPAAAGWLIGGTWQAALAAMLWAGLARIALLQHVTWSVNSLCHLIRHPPVSPPAAMTARPTCGRSPCSRSAKAGTTATTPTLPVRGTAPAPARSTSPPRSSASSSASAGLPPSTGPTLPASPPGIACPAAAAARPPASDTPSPPGPS